MNCPKCGNDKWKLAYPKRVIVLDALRDTGYKPQANPGKECTGCGNFIPWWKVRRENSLSNNKKGIKK